MPLQPLRTASALSALLGLCLVLLMSGTGSVQAATTPPANGVTVVPEVPYGPGAQLLLDVYREADAADAPVVILIHGGGWNQGDKDKFEDESRGLAKVGFVVFDINYTLPPGEKAAYPRQIQDVHTALAWVQTNAATYGGDADRIGVLGGSAGGYLAAMLAFQANSAEAQPVKALVSLSGPMNLPLVVAGLEVAKTNADGTCSPAPCDVLEGATNSLQTLLGCSPVDCPPALVTEASPITYVSQYSPPSYFANSTEEVVLPDQSATTADVLEADGVPVETAVVPGDFHSVELLPAVGTDILAFLTKYVVNAVVTPTPSATSPTPSETPVATIDDGGRAVWRWYVVAGLLLLLVVAFVVQRLRSREP